MRKKFDELSQNSRIWIYQSDRAICEEEATRMIQDTDEFLHQWAAHGSDLLASATILYDHFLVLAVDEGFNMTSGCSIDSQVRFIQEIAKKYKIDLFNRTNLAFWKSNQVELIPMSDMKSQVEKDYFAEEVKFFDNNINKKEELENKWLVDPKESWLKRYFQTAKSVL